MDLTTGNAINAIKECTACQTLGTIRNALSNMALPAHPGAGTVEVNANQRAGHAGRTYVGCTWIGASFGWFVGIRATHVGITNPDERGSPACSCGFVIHTSGLQIPQNRSRTPNTNHPTPPLRNPLSLHERQRLFESAHCGIEVLVRVDARGHSARGG